MKKISFNKIFVVINAVVILPFIFYMIVKLAGLFPISNDEYSINFLSLLGFLLFAVLLVVFLTRVKNMDKKKLYLCCFLLFSVILVFYDYSINEIWVDARGDAITSNKVVEVGPNQFMKEYHLQAMQTIKDDELLEHRFEKYTTLFPFIDFDKYIERSNSESYTSVDYDRTVHHPPLWFIIQGGWQSLFGNSNLSLKILIKVIALIYILSLFFVVRQFLKKDRILSILVVSLIVLTPRFLISAETPKNDFLLGIGTAWFVYFLLKNTSKRISHYDLLVGLFFLISVISKFTGLLLIIPLLVYYFVNFKMSAFRKLIIVSIPVLSILFILFLLYDYNVILNIITGRVKQDTVVNRFWNDKLGYLFNKVLYGFYYVGIPILVIVITGMIKYFRGKVKISKNVLILSLFYFSVFLLLWGSTVSRHQIGFIGFLVPFIATYIGSIESNRKLISNIFVFLIVYDVLIVINSYVNLLEFVGNPWVG